MLTPQNSDAYLVKPSRTEIASKYHVEDLAGAVVPGSRLSNILEQIESGRSLSNHGLEFLSSKGILALFRFANKEIDFAEFLKTSEIEQAERRLTAKAKALKEQAEQKMKDEAMQASMRLAQERAEAKQLAYDNDPRNKAKAKRDLLREKYGLADFIEKADFPKLMDILHRVDNGVRLSEDEVVWLSTQGNENYDKYYTSELKDGFHRNEAEFDALEFKKNKDPWSAVNASSHYRKCNKSNTADSMLCTITMTSLTNLKLKSAICTTHGGVKRDLQKWNEALVLGEQAHQLTPKNFRPCTLLGAVNTEIGNLSLGRSWYDKAVQRGYSEKSMDDDIRSIFIRADKTKQGELRDYLLNIDSYRYRWAQINHRD